MREIISERGRGHSRPRFRDAYNSRQNSSRAFKSSSSNNRNIARAQDFYGAPSGPLPHINNSRWDLAPPGLEKYTAQQVKLVGIFSPGKPIPESELVRVLDKLSVGQLDPEHSALNRSLIIEGDYKSWCYELFESIGMPTTTKERGALVEFKTPKHVAVLLACPGTLVLKRPPGLVTSNSKSLWSNHATRHRAGDDHQPSPVDAATVRSRKGELLAQFWIGEETGTRLYPEINDAPASPRIEELDKIPTRTETRTIVILNGEDNERMRQLLDGANSIVPIKNDTLKIFAQFESVESARAIGTKLHLKQFGTRKLLCAFWDDRAFELGIY